MPLRPTTQGSELLYTWEALGPARGTCRTPSPKILALEFRILERSELEVWVLSLGVLVFDMPDSLHRVQG